MDYPFPMFKIENPYKAWWICRACQLVTVTHLSEDGRKAIVCREGEQEGLTVDADDVFDTNEKALDELKKHSDYLKAMRDKIRGRIINDLTASEEYLNEGPR